MSYLTDAEKRLLFAALSREKEICKKFDDEHKNNENVTLLVPIIESLERKFYYDRFEKEIEKKVTQEYQSPSSKEQDEWIKLPCKVGSDVYRINKYDESIKLYTVESFDITKQQIFIHLERNIGTLCIEISDFGKTVFLTKEEAEQALEQMKAGK